MIRSAVDFDIAAEMLAQVLLFFLFFCLLLDLNFELIKYKITSWTVIWTVCNMCVLAVIVRVNIEYMIAKKQEKLIVYLKYGYLMNFLLY